MMAERIPASDRSGGAGNPGRPDEGAGSRGMIGEPAERVPVLVVVPTRNSERTLAKCLHSLREQSLRPRIVVVDNHSDDATQAIAGELADDLIIAGPERSAQRNIGAQSVPGAEIIGFVDSDMIVAPNVVAEVADLVASGAGAVVVPERTIGRGMVAKIRAFERSQYVGNSQVEAPRFFSHTVWADVGGFDEALTAGEDWDLALRAADAGADTRHSQSPILHDEARIGYFAHCAKKGHYALGIRRFYEKHGHRARVVLLDRPYLRHPARLLRNPILGIGLVLLKLGEVIAVVVKLALHHRASDPASVNRTDAPGGSPSVRPGH